MGSGALHWCVWVWLLLAQGASLLLFSAGFFLTRLELGEESGCDPRPLLEPLGAIDLWAGNRTNGGVASGGAGGEHGDRRAGCWTPRTYDRVVLFVVDALRYDFVAYDEQRGGGGDGGGAGGGNQDTTPSFLNKMSVVRELMQTEPGATLLTNFVADAPTGNKTTPCSVSPRLLLQLQRASPGRLCTNSTATTPLADSSPHAHYRSNRRLETPTFDPTTITATATTATATTATTNDNTGLHNNHYRVPSRVPRRQ